MNHIIIKAVGWSKSYNTNWAYRYYDVTIISKNLDLLKLQGIYADTFGKVENHFETLRKIENLDVIIDYTLADVAMPQRKMLKLSKGKDFENILKVLQS